MQMGSIVVAVAAVTAAIAAFPAAVSAETCPQGHGDPYMMCGSVNQVTCCIEGQYCQPWSSGIYQCINNLAGCTTMHTEVDLFGDDLYAVYGLRPDKCAEQCQQTEGCVAFTYINNNPGSPACYLKSGYGQERELKGAVSCKR